MKERRKYKLDLTAREIEILEALRQVRDTKLVAGRLGISISTVYNTLSKIRKKRTSAFYFLNRLKRYEAVLFKRKSGYKEGI